VASPHYIVDDCYDETSDQDMFVYLKNTVMPEFVKELKLGEWIDVFPTVN
jgi:hypothetical protein